MRGRAFYQNASDTWATSHTMMLLREDLASCAKHLHSRDLCNVLLAAHYMRIWDDALLAPVCAAAAQKVEQFSLRDVATTVYSLGKLGRASDGELLPRLLSRVRAEARELHAIELMYVASGLEDLRLAPPSLLPELTAAAGEKLEQFGARELGGFLGSLSSVGWHDHALLLDVEERLPLLVNDMGPHPLLGTVAAIAAADAWRPHALDLLCEQAVSIADQLSPEQTAALLASLGRLRWDHPAACAALSSRLRDCAPELPLDHLGVALRAASRLPNAASGEALGALRDAVALAPLPAVEGRPAGAQLRALAMVSNALVHLELPPPPRLLELLRRLDLDNGEPPTSGRERRALSKLGDARRTWEVAAAAAADGAPPPPLTTATSAGALPGSLPTASVPLSALP